MDRSDISTSVIFNWVSDNFHSIISFKILDNKHLPTKYVNTKTKADNGIGAFQEDLPKTNISLHLKSKFIGDPDLEYKKWWYHGDFLQETYF